MALRPIDNALPTSPDRPKKQAKLSVLVQSKKSSESLPPSIDASVDYISSENLKPFEDPESIIQNLVEGLDSKDWVKFCDSLNDARRENVILVVVKAMKNPGSALCKTSIMSTSDIFNAFGEKLLDSTDAGAFYQLLLQLLLKTSLDKKFVCEEADRSLNTMVRSIAPSPLIQKLRGYVNHTNLRVRAKAAVSISNPVSKMGSEEIKEFGMVPLLQMAADLQSDKSPEAREAARSIVFSIYKALTKNGDENKEEVWQSFCQTNLPPIYAQSMIKLVARR